MSKELNDSEFLLMLAKRLDSIAYDELTSIEKMIYARFSKLGMLTRDIHDEVEFVA